jgi:hypothetical protein
MGTITVRYRTLATLLLLLAAVLLVFHTCTSTFGHEELARVSSPDESVDAVLVRYNGIGATVGYIYALHLEPGNDRLLDDEGTFVLAADHLDEYGMQLTWQGDHVLQVRYESAAIHDFKKEWTSEGIGTGTSRVRVDLIRIKNR